MWVSQRDGEVNNSDLLGWTCNEMKWSDWRTLLSPWKNNFHWKLVSVNLANFRQSPIGVKLYWRFKGDVYVKQSVHTRLLMAMPILEPEQMYSLIDRLTSLPISYKLQSTIKKYGVRTPSFIPGVEWVECLYAQDAIIITTVLRIRPDIWADYKIQKFFWTWEWNTIHT